MSKIALPFVSVDYDDTKAAIEQLVNVLSDSTGIIQNAINSMDTSVTALKAIGLTSAQTANTVFAAPDAATATTGTPSFRALTATDIPNLAASKITSGTLALARGGTNADLSATGGTSKVLQQISVGAGITVGQLAITDISSPGAFSFQISNVAGTLQHRFVQDQDSTTLPTYVGSISGASATLQNTPSVGAGTDFTTGAGIDSAATRYLIFKSGIQNAGLCLYTCAMAYNDTGLDFWPDLVQRSSNVNGTTQNRLAIEFRNRGTGAAQGITTANIPAGNTIIVKVFGFF